MLRAQYQWFPETIYFWFCWLLIVNEWPLPPKLELLWSTVNQSFPPKLSLNVGISMMIVFHHFWLTQLKPWKSLSQDAIALSLITSSSCSVPIPCLLFHSHPLAPMHFHWQFIISLTYAFLHLHTQISIEDRSLKYPSFLIALSRPFRSRMVELMLTYFGNKIWIIRDVFGVLASISYVKSVCLHLTTGVAFKAI